MGSVGVSLLMRAHKTRQICQFIVVMFCLPLILGGCSGGSSSGITAEQVASQFYQAVKKNDFAKAATLFTDYKPRAEREQELREYKDKLGDLQSFELRDKIVNTVFSGVRYTYKYRVQYSKFDATELLIMFEKVSEGKLEIEVRQVKSKGLR